MPHGNRPGDELGGRYTLVDLLNESRGGRFWRARDQVLARHVAIHVIAADDDRAPGLLEAARRSTAVQDRRMLRVLDADERDGLVYVVNEWGTGTSLDILLADQPLSPRRAAWIVSEVADAVAAAHAVGVPHGHLIPENVLVDTVGSVRLIGHAVDAALRGVGPGRPEDDVVNIVGLLYSGLTGRWAGQSYSEVEPAPTEDGYVLRPRQVRAGIPRVLDQLCGDVLDAAHAGAGAPSGRRDSSPQDAAGIAAMLQEFVGDPLEMAAAEAARGHGSMPSVNLDDPDPGGSTHARRSHGPGAAADTSPDTNPDTNPDTDPDTDPEMGPDTDPDTDPAVGASEVDAGADDVTRREMPAAKPAEEVTQEVELPAAGGGGADEDGSDAGGPTMAVPAVDEADDPDTDEPGTDDSAHEGGPSDSWVSRSHDAPTQAGVPIFRDDTDEVGWVGKQQEKPPPPPPLEDPPERPLFAPDPPDGQPQRRSRSGTDDHGSWPSGTGGWASMDGAVFEEEPARERVPVPGRRWFRLAVLVGIASLTFLVVIFVADLLRGGQPLGVGPAPDDSASPSDESSQEEPEPVAGLESGTLDPQGDGEENDGDVALVVDGDPATTWRTSTYFQQLGPQGLKTGVGLVVDLGESTAVREVDLRLVGAPTTAELYLTDEEPSDVTDLEPVGEIAATNRRGSAELSGEESGRYLVVWLTSLPAVDGGFRGEIGEVVVRA